MIELSSLFLNAGRCKDKLARSSARARELPEQAPQAFLVLGDARIKLAVRALEIGIRYERRRAGSAPGDVDHVEIMFLDDSVEVDVNEVLDRRCSPISCRLWL